ncbi:hypothetical protein [Roseivirga misakiensis]|nr:hypothetical protein [Roseivirga misakiensis]
MIFQGMPWPLVLPIALMALIIGAMNSKKEMAKAKKLKAKRKKR